MAETAVDSINSMDAPVAAPTILSDDEASTPQQQQQVEEEVLASSNAEVTPRKKAADP